MAPLAREMDERGEMPMALVLEMAKLGLLGIALPAEYGGGAGDNGWLDFRGHPATDAMRVTETFRRPTLIGLELEVTFNDPKAYTKPWSVKAAFDLMPDDEFIEHVCENEVTYERLSGNSK